MEIIKEMGINVIIDWDSILVKECSRAITVTRTMSEHIHKYHIRSTWISVTGKMVQI